MFCSQCGANNADNALVCVQCGRSLQPGTAAAPLPVTGVVLPPGATVPNYLVFAILTTVFCCLPTGIPAIVYAAQVNAANCRLEIWPGRNWPRRTRKCGVLFLWDSASLCVCSTES